MKLPKSLEIKCQEKAEKYARVKYEGKNNIGQPMYSAEKLQDLSLREVRMEAFKSGCATGFELGAQLSQSLIEAITRRMKSDDACGHPFDEVLGEALNEYKKAMED